SAPPPPQQTQGKLPKGTAASSGGTGKSRKQELEDYEKDYLARFDLREADAEAEAAQAQAQASSSQKHGSLPKGFTPQSTPPPPPPKPQEKYAKGLLPKGS
ncbi:MAG: trans-sialidase, partial [Nitrosopumilaceae archaeon]